MYINILVFDSDLR